MRVPTEVGTQTEMNKQTRSRIAQTQVTLFKTCVNLQPAFLALSSHGVGLFVQFGVKKGAWVTEYGGQFIDQETAQVLRETKQASHVKSIDFPFTAYDGRTTENLTHAWYAQRHLLGSFANDPHGSAFAANVECVSCHVPEGHREPAGGNYTMTRLFLRATKAIEADGEVLFNYGKGYHNDYFSQLQTRPHLDWSTVEFGLSTPFANVGKGENAASQVRKTFFFVPACLSQIVDSHQAFLTPSSKRALVTTNAGTLGTHSCSIWLWRKSHCHRLTRLHQAFLTLSSKRTTDA